MKPNKRCVQGPSEKGLSLIVPVWFSCLLLLLSYYHSSHSELFSALLMWTVYFPLWDSFTVRQTIKYWELLYPSCCHERDSKVWTCWRQDVSECVGCIHSVAPHRFIFSSCFYFVLHSAIKKQQGGKWVIAQRQQRHNDLSSCISTDADGNQIW